MKIKIIMNRGDQMIQITSSAQLICMPFNRVSPSQSYSLSLLAPSLTYVYWMQCSAFVMMMIIIIMMMIITPSKSQSTLAMSNAILCIHPTVCFPFEIIIFSRDHWLWWEIDPQTAFSSSLFHSHSHRHPHHYLFIQSVEGYCQVVWLSFLLQ